MMDTQPRPRVLILCADRRLSRGLCLYAEDMGLDPVWKTPADLPGVPADAAALTEACGASLLWADADDCPLLADRLPPGFPAVLWSRTEAPSGTAQGLPVRIHRPVDTALLETASRRCLDAAPGAPLPAPAASDPAPAAPHVTAQPADEEILPALTPLEARLLDHLRAHRGETVTRDALNELLGITNDAGNMVDVYVYRLRKKLEKPGERLITAVRGKGYRML